MKSRSLLFLALSMFLLSPLTYGQTTLTINLDASLLANPSCDLNAGGVPDNKVYMHAGLCTQDPATDGSDPFANQVFCFTQITPFESEVWQHVVGNWGDDPQDDGVGLMDYDSGTMWSKTIVIEDYFTDTALVNLDSSTVMPAGAIGYVMGLVFRDKDGVFAGRDDQCKDIFIVELNTDDPRVVQGHDITKPFPAVTLSKTVGVKDIPTLGQFSAYPNPSRGEVNVSYFLRKPTANVKVKIMNNLGQEVAMLTDGYQNRGHQRFVWNGDAHGNPAPNGIYHLVVSTDEAVLANEKIVLIR